MTIIKFTVCFLFQYLWILILLPLIENNIHDDSIICTATQVLPVLQPKASNKDEFHFFFAVIASITLVLPITL